MRPIAYASILALLLASAAHATGTVAEKCAHDRDALLALDEQAFDQDLSGGGGGWRAVGNIPGCESVAADLIAAYRAKHPQSGSLLAWHEGQMRASAGMNQQAILLLEGVKKDPASDIAGWNHYVDATVAFLRGDKPALQRARDSLASVPYRAEQGMPPLQDGHIELPTQRGQPPARMRWPPNIDVVDGLLRCFGKPYAEAYGSCRK